MPQMANITVKDEANVDVVFSSLTPSSGDTTQAQWRAAALATTPMYAPALTTRTQYNGAKNGRSFSLNAIFPVTQVDGGVETVVAKQPFQLTTTIPLNIPRAKAVRHAKILASLIASALIQEILADGYNAS